MSKPPERTHTAKEMEYAIDIISICGPIRDIEGRMWFGHNHNFADATFVDHGVCRAMAVAARMLGPNLTRIAELEAELAAARSAPYAAKFRPLLEVGHDYQYGGMDYRAHGGVLDLTPEQMNQFRAMIPLAIKEIEMMWDHSPNHPMRQHPAAQSLPDHSAQTRES